MQKDLSADEATIQVFSTKLMLLSVVKGMCTFVFFLFLIATLGYTIRIFTQKMYQCKEEFFTMCALGQKRYMVCLEYVLPYMYLVFIVSLLGCGIAWQLFIRLMADFSELFSIKIEGIFFAYQKKFFFCLVLYSYLFIRLFFKVRKGCDKI